MKKSIVQIENTNSNDFKNEILDGIGNLLKRHSSLNSKEGGDKILTREETAKMLSISLVTLWKWTKNDIIPAFRIGGKVRYKKEDIISALNQMNQFKDKK